MESIKGLGVCVRKSGFRPLHYYAVGDGFTDTSWYISRRFVYQKDNTAAHTARDTMLFFPDMNIESLAWAPRSPDTTIIENCSDCYRVLCMMGRSSSALLST